jgi:DNA-binding beta-propeller fold protein YncE
MAVEPSGNLVVSDARRQTVMRFDPSGHLLSEWGPRLGMTTLDQPAGVAVYGDSFYVIDRGTPRIFRLDVTGRVEAILSLEPLAPYGLNGLAIDSRGDLYAADTGRNRLLVIATNGQLRRQLGRGGADLGAFTQPMMLAFAPDGSFFVADWENSRIERWTPAFEAIDAWPTGFRPWGVAVDQNGRVFVPDTEKRRVQVYTPRGTWLAELGVPGSPLLEVAPRQLAFDRSNARSLYVLGGDGIQRLDLENSTAPPQGGAEVDVFSLAIIALLLAVLATAVLSRRARRAAVRSVGPAPNRPVRLHTENGAQRQHQQTQPDQELLITHQPKREQ